jgi:hypothetical protein
MFDLATLGFFDRKERKTQREKREKWHRREPKPELVSGMGKNWGQRAAAVAV